MHLARWEELKVLPREHRPLQCLHSIPKPRPECQGSGSYSATEPRAPHSGISVLGQGARLTSSFGAKQAVQQTHMALSLYDDVSTRNPETYYTNLYSASWLPVIQLDCVIPASGSRSPKPRLAVLDNSGNHAHHLSSEYPNKQHNRQQDEGRARRHTHIPA